MPCIIVSSLGNMIAALFFLYGHSTVGGLFLIVSFLLLLFGVAFEYFATADEKEERKPQPPERPLHDDLIRYLLERNTQNRNEGGGKLADRVEGLEKATEALDDKLTRYNEIYSQLLDILADRRNNL